MKRILVFALVAMMLCSCGAYKKNPVCQGIEKKAMEQYEGKKYSFRFQDFALVDSVMLRSEVENRIKTFTIKIERNKILYNRYIRTGYTVNADIKKQTLLNDSVILIKLGELQKELDEAGQLDKVAYYIYKFTAIAKVEEKTLKMVDCYASATPENEVLTLAPDFKSVQKGTGKVIPHYTEIVKTIATEDEEEE